MVDLTQKRNLERNFETVQESYQRISRPKRIYSTCDKNAGFESTAFSTAVSLHQTENPG